MHSKLSCRNWPSITGVDIIIKITKRLPTVVQILNADKRSDTENYRSSGYSVPSPDGRVMCSQCKIYRKTSSLRYSIERLKIQWE